MLSTLMPSNDQNYEEQVNRARTLSAGKIRTRSSSTCNTPSGTPTIRPRATSMVEERNVPALKLEECGTMERSALATNLESNHQQSGPLSDLKPAHDGTEAPAQKDTFLPTSIMPQTGFIGSIEEPQSNSDAEIHQHAISDQNASDSTMESSELLTHNLLTVTVNEQCEVSDAPTTSSCTNSWALTVYNPSVFAVASFGEETNRLRPKSDENDSRATLAVSTEKSSDAIVTHASTSTNPPENDHPAAEKHNLGLRNLGNTCYLNSAVQMICTQHEFLVDLLRYDQEMDSKLVGLMEHQRQLDELPKRQKDIDCDVDKKEGLDGESGAGNKSDEKKKPLLRKALLQLAKSMKLIPSLAYSSDVDLIEGQQLSYRGFGSYCGRESADPSLLKATMDELCCLFEGYQQQDSHEFCSTVLDMLHDEILEEQKRFQVEGKEEDHESSKDGQRLDQNQQENEPELDDENNSTEDEVMEESGAPDALCLEEPSEENDTNLLSQKRSHIELEHDVIASTGSLPDLFEIPASPIAGATRRASRVPSFSMLDTDAISSLLQEDMTSSIDESTSAEAVLPTPLPSSKMARLTSTQPLLLLGGRISLPSGSKTWGKCSGFRRMYSLPSVTPASLITVPDASDAVENNAAMADDSLCENVLPLEDVPSPVNEIDENNKGNAHTTSSPQQGEQAGCSADDATCSFCSPVESHFSALVEVRLTCDSCSYTRTKTEMYRYFSLDLSSRDSNGSDNDGVVNNVEESLRQFFKPERIELKCEKCFFGCATETKEITRLPRSLILHFKRFIVEMPPPGQWSYGGVTFRKNKSPVEFGPELDLKDYCNGIKDETREKHEDDLSSMSWSYETKFRLKSVVHHLGSTASCGHYTADALRSIPRGTEETEVYEQRWMHFNDEYVTEAAKTDEDTFYNSSAQTSAYMILYELVN